MIRVTARDNSTEIEMSGAGADLAKELHRIVRHISSKLLGFCEPDRQKKAAEILAMGMATAVREGLDDARKEAAENDDACHESMAH